MTTANTSNWKRRPYSNWGDLIHEGEVYDAIGYLESKIDNVKTTDSMLTTFDATVGITSSMHLQTVEGDSKYSKAYSFAPFQSPLGNAGTGVVNKGGASGPTMFRGCDRDHCPFYYKGGIYVFCTYESSVAPPASSTDGGKFIIYRLNEKTSTMQVHRLVTTGIIVKSNAAGNTFAPAKYIWRPKPFLYNGRPLVVFTAMFDWTDMTIPLQTIVGEMTDDLSDMPFFTVVNDTIYASNVLANGSNILSARYIDQEPIIDAGGVFRGFLMKDEIYERANRSNNGSGSWNRIVFAGTDGKFVKQINGFNSMKEPDAPSNQLDVEGLSLKQNTDSSTGWTAWFQSINTSKVYVCKLDSTFEYIPNTVALVPTPFGGMGSVEHTPNLNNLFQ